MVTTVQREDTDTVRPNWPQHARQDGEVIDMRDDTSRPYVAEDQRVEPARRGLRARRTLGWILAAAMLAVVAIVATVNRSGDIGIDLVVDDGALPLWGVIAGAAALGFGAGRFLDDGC
jgi:hypothetical protein